MVYVDFLATDTAVNGGVKLVMVMPGNLKELIRKHFSECGCSLEGKPTPHGYWKDKYWIPAPHKGSVEAEKMVWQEGVK